jgi:hypothetical protein
MNLKAVSLKLLVICFRALLLSLCAKVNDEIVAQVTNLNFVPLAATVVRRCGEAAERQEAPLGHTALTPVPSVCPHRHCVSLSVCG